jgi:hypothetical protein
LEVSETVLWFVVVPALLVLVIAGLAYALSGDRRSKRYRPGRPYEVAPVWFLAAPDKVDATARKLAIAGGSESTAGGPGGGVVERRVPAQGATGGASDRW